MCVRGLELVLGRGLPMQYGAFEGGTRGDGESMDSFQNYVPYPIS